MLDKNFFEIKSPLNGKILPIEKVPDPVFSDRVLGDGCAVVPTDGKIYSPFDGVVTSIADTLHAYSIKNENGIEVLIHFGLETVSLSGDGFKAYVSVGDTVKAGDLIAEADIEFLQRKNINLITPVVVCDSPAGMKMRFSEGKASAGADTIMTIYEEQSETAKKPQKDKSPKVSFDFLQKLGKVLMVVIAVMPAAGLAISIGKLVAMLAGDITFLTTTGVILENIGWAIISNLHILFAVAIGGSWAKEKAGGAFAALLAFILINNITGSIFGVTSDMLSDPDAVTHTLFGQKIAVSGYFTSVLGTPALNMGVFVGIISGFAGGIIYNKFYNFRKLPNALAFFNGKRFVPLVVIFWSVLLSLVLSVVWPVIQLGINKFGVWIAGSADTSPILAPFVYGTLERLLLPFGLHHMLTIPMNYTSFGGTYIIQTGVSAGAEVFGQDPLWLAWITDLI
ncbi:MAG: PTS glucose transporter subunit IIA, partial [Oscillospiraceae bacterium]|nr:PTS glucose transporter subunit IIA [Oscillospiraceae bacterium]